MKFAHRDKYIMILVKNVVNILNNIIIKYIIILILKKILYIYLQ